MSYGLVARQLDAFLVNIITTIDAVPVNFRYYFLLPWKRDMISLNLGEKCKMGTNLEKNKT